MKRRLLALTAFIILVFMTACSEGSSKTEAEKKGEGQDKMKVTSTTAQIGDIVKNVGGEHVEAESLMGPGTDPHLYQATQQDIGKLNGADIIFYNGLNLEGKMGKFSKR